MCDHRWVDAHAPYTASDVRLWTLTGGHPTLRGLPCAARNATGTRNPMPQCVDDRQDVLAQGAWPLRSGALGPRLTRLDHHRVSQAHHVAGTVTAHACLGSHPPILDPPPEDERCRPVHRQGRLLIDQDDLGDLRCMQQGWRLHVRPAGRGCPQHTLMHAHTGVLQATLVRLGCSACVRMLANDKQRPGSQTTQHSTIDRTAQRGDRLLRQNLETPCRSDAKPDAASATSGLTGLTLVTADEDPASTFWSIRYLRRHGLAAGV